MANYMMQCTKLAYHNRPGRVPAFPRGHWERENGDTIHSDLNRPLHCCRVAMLRGRLPVRADRRSRTDKKPSVRNRRSRIGPNTVFAVNSNRDFRADAFYPRGNRGSRAQRATPLAACGSIYVAAYSLHAFHRDRVLREGLLERVMGIEPTSKAWEAFVLPLNYTRTCCGF